MNRRIIIFFVAGFVFTASGCDSRPEGSSPVGGQDRLAAGVKVDEPNQPSDGDDMPDVAPLLPTPEAVIPVPPPGWDGCSYPVYTGGNDDGEEEECGGTEQDVLPSPNGCPHLLYGVSNSGNASTLLSLGHLTGAGTPIASVTGVNNIGGIDFSPGGQLYGVGTAIMSGIGSSDISFSSGDSVLAIIDCRTSATVIIGPTLIETNFTPPVVITDIDFDWRGELFAHADTGAGKIIGTIDIGTGLFSAIGGPTGTSGGLDGIGFAPFLINTLYGADGTNLYRVDLISGMVSSTVAPLNFPGSLVSPSINAMDLDPFTNIMYASVSSSGPTSYLGVLDFTNGHVSLVSFSPTAVQPLLDAIAVNR